MKFVIIATAVGVCALCVAAAPTKNTSATTEPSDITTELSDITTEPSNMTNEKSTTTTDVPKEGEGTVDIEKWRRFGKRGFRGGYGGDYAVGHRGYHRGYGSYGDLFGGFGDGYTRQFGRILGDGCYGNRGYDYGR